MDVFNRGSGALGFYEVADVANLQTLAGRHPRGYGLASTKSSPALAILRTRPPASARSPPAFTSSVSETQCSALAGYEQR